MNSGELKLNDILKHSIPLDIVIHGIRVGILASKIAKELDLCDENLLSVAFAGAIHDIGKIFIDKNILYKNGSLTEVEFKEIKKHADYGCRIAKEIPGLSKFCEILLLHHEYEDKSGYYHKESREIPLLAKIIVVADVFDALTSERSYRSAYSIEEALREMYKTRQKFDAYVFDAFLNVIEHQNKVTIANII